MASRFNSDKFSVLGVPRRFEIDVRELEQRYRALSRELHPDRFATAPASERVMSLQAATTVNDAYRTLKGPLRRAQYLLELAGAGIDENDKADPDLLLEVMELREALSEAKENGDALAIDRLRAIVQKRYDAAFASLRDGFSAHDASGDRADLMQVRERLMELRYYQRFLDEAAPPEEVLE